MTIMGFAITAQHVLGAVAALGALETLARLTPNNVDNKFIAGIGSIFSVLNIRKK